ncbi:isoaspartyl peptidase/L-asparaginase [Sphingobacterium sp. lm-10]|uniref:isoaspartyl peptidase/L-asparaginase family protein n=1 Tax=Sphingobacterium sp. lm-10 TaxID=2944904 RepID=UPI002021696A|nr:isoaspartyl peptidase/L-asparaginase [Sphingobacterium sp. lm-10]MCL7986534.1 isoaspartyl peptidase/L-asparaginase [Sphingobacterium sp. lm-10]
MIKKSLFLIFMCFALQFVVAQQRNYVMAIHGGAGTILKKNLTDSMEAAYKDGLKQALLAGYRILQEEGGTSLDAVEAAVKVLEDNPLFNAGKGAVFTSEGKNELDAAIMDGKTLSAGAVAGVTNIKSPIQAARAVMQHSPHVMMVGAGAEQFAKEQGLEIVDPSYFYTKERWDGLQKARELDSLATQLDHDAQSGIHEVYKDYKYGTVGAVAVDRAGNLAAATSTGGMTNKRYGRVGDAPITGAGNYADNATVAVSCTGWGEFFIRSVAAYDVAARVQYGGLSIADAAAAVIKKIGDMGGDGGLIAINKQGEVAMPFNTAGMYRGVIKADGTIEVEIYK